MKLTRAMKRVTGRLTTMRQVIGQLNGREEGQWSAEWPKAGHWSADDLKAAGHLVHFSLFSKKSEDSLPPILLKDIYAIHKCCLWTEDILSKLPHCKDELIFFKYTILRIRVDGTIISINKGKKYSTRQKKFTLTIYHIFTLGTLSVCV
jgi:hypothetical protein